MSFWGILFLLLGLWALIAPQSLIDFKVKTAKMAGATFKTSKKTVTFYRYVGAGLLLLGLFLMFA